MRESDPALRAMTFVARMRRASSIAQLRALHRRVALSGPASTPRLPTVVELPQPIAERNGVRLCLLRDDLLHPQLPGNKLRKLKYNLLAANEGGHDSILTFGGAYSNHLSAVAAAGQIHGLRTVGVVRGDADADPSPTLQRCRAAGMQLHFVDREAYRQRSDPHYVAGLLRELGPAYVIPEGGTNVLALRGCAELVEELEAAAVPFDALTVACGTGGTLAGLLVGLQGRKQVVGVPALKGGAFLRHDIDALTAAAVGHTYTNYHLHTEAHFGGYARYSAELVRFVEDFYARHAVLLDPVYTCKAVWGTLDLIGRGFFSRGSTVVVIHTGGLQGWAGFQQRFGVALPVAWESELPPGGR